MRVLARCDGRRTMAQIIELLEAEDPPLERSLIYPCISEALRKGILRID
jgi:hypothetical protein